MLSYHHAQFRKRNRRQRMEFKESSIYTLAHINPLPLNNHLSSVRFFGCGCLLRGLVTYKQPFQPLDCHQNTINTTIDKFCSTAAKREQQREDTPCCARHSSDCPSVVSIFISSSSDFSTFALLFSSSLPWCRCCRCRRFSLPAIPSS